MKSLIIALMLALSISSASAQYQLSEEEMCMDVAVSYTVIGHYRDDGIPLQNFNAAMDNEHKEGLLSQEMLSIVQFAAEVIYQGEWRALTPRQIGVIAFQNCLMGD